MGCVKPLKLRRLLAYWVRKVNAYLEKKGISFQDIFGTTSDEK